MNKAIKLTENEQKLLCDLVTDGLYQMLCNIKQFPNTSEAYMNKLAIINRSIKANFHALSLMTNNKMKDNIVITPATVYVAKKIIANTDVDMNDLTNIIRVMNPNIEFIFQLLKVLNENEDSSLYSIITKSEKARHISHKELLMYYAFNAAHAIYFNYSYLLNPPKDENKE